MRVQGSAHLHVDCVKKKTSLIKSLEHSDCLVFLSYVWQHVWQLATDCRVVSCFRHHSPPDPQPLTQTVLISLFERSFLKTSSFPDRSLCFFTKDKIVAAPSNHLEPGYGERALSLASKFAQRPLAVLRLLNRRHVCIRNLVLLYKSVRQIQTFIYWKHIIMLEDVKQKVMVQIYYIYLPNVAAKERRIAVWDTVDLSHLLKWHFSTLWCMIWLLSHVYDISLSWKSMGLNGEVVSDINHLSLPYLPPLCDNRCKARER